MESSLCVWQPASSTDWCFPVSSGREWWETGFSAKQFYTLRVYDRDVSDIEGIVGLGAVMKSNVVNRLVDDVIGSLRGFPIRFADGLMIPMGRMEMTNVEPLVLHLVNDCGDPFSMGRTPNSLC